MSGVACCLNDPVGSQIDWLPPEIYVLLSPPFERTIMMKSQISLGFLLKTCYPELVGVVLF